MPALIAGRYRVEGTLGTGGAGQVFRVTDVARNRELALKRLHAGASKGVTALFELEYQTLAGLRHPRIVEVFEYGRDEGAAFYTMELLQGEDLKDRAPMPWREACLYLRDAAQALGLLHARRLVHRDVSPRNLWRMPDGRVKLLDFGALVPFGPCDKLVGTPPLVPPEAYESQELDQRTDLYALGAVGYYLLTGMHAYPARGLRDLPELWTYEPVPASQRVAELARPDLEAVPGDLDILIAA
ncbi:MAG TPA: serine/threonine-protein kinase, partial [Polyangiaceae bacterium]|nr:serine/threonine-protein kinase [Polyangiaceae bacterium]